MITNILLRDFTIAKKSANGLILSFVIMLISITLFSFLSEDKSKDFEFFTHILFVTLTFSALLSSNQILANDMEDGSIFQLITFGVTPINLVISKIIFHFLISALPIIIATPMLASIFAINISITLLIYVLLFIGIILSFISVYCAFTISMLGKNALIGNIISLPLMIAPLILAKLSINFSFYNSTQDNYYLKLLAGITLITSASAMLMSVIIYKDNLSNLKR
jgi:heme exporter protein B